MLTAGVVDAGQTTEVPVAVDGVETIVAPALVALSRVRAHLRRRA